MVPFVPRPPGPGLGALGGTRPVRRVAVYACSLPVTLTRVERGSRRVAQGENYGRPSRQWCPDVGLFYLRVCGNSPRVQLDCARSGELVGPCLDVVGDQSGRSPGVSSRAGSFAKRFQYANDSALADVLRSAQEYEIKLTKVGVSCLIITGRSSSGWAKSTVTWCAPDCVVDSASCVAGRDRAACRGGPAKKSCPVAVCGVWGGGPRVDRSWSCQPGSRLGASRIDSLAGGRVGRSSGGGKWGWWLEMDRGSSDVIITGA